MVYDSPMTRNIGPGRVCPICGALLYGSMGHTDSCKTLKAKLAQMEKKTRELANNPPKCFGSYVEEDLKCEKCESALACSFQRKSLNMFK